MPLAEVFERVGGPDADVEFVAFDGSKAGRPGSPGVTISIRTPMAVSYLAQAPGALGLARAYVSGHLDVEGEMYTALSRLASAQRTDLSLPERLSVLHQLGGPQLLIRRLAPPQQEVRLSRQWLSGRRHSRDRDATAISHHSDVSNTFPHWGPAPSLCQTCSAIPA